MIPLRTSDWMTVVSDDLIKFVGEGGALVRFAVGDKKADLSSARTALKEQSASSNLYFFDVGASQSRIHYVNDILAAVGEQLDLRSAIASFLFSAAAEEGYEVGDASDFDLNDIARLNSTAPQEILAVLNQQIRRRILRDDRLARDVRYALWAATSEVLLGDHYGTAVSLTERWFTGNASSIRELREFGIVQKVSRYNARAVLRSLFTWLPATGSAGSILYIDGSRLADRINPRDGLIYYTRAALSDVYEVVREFIDGTEHMNSVMIVFGMPKEFLSIDPTDRGFGMYQALQHRVSPFEEMHFPNPLANLVLLSSNAEARSFA